MNSLFCMGSYAHRASQTAKLNSNIVCYLSIQHDRRQDPTAITGLSDKMYLLCKNGKHSLQLWQSVSLDAKSFLIENPMTFCRNLGREVSQLDFIGDSSSSLGKTRMPFLMVSGSYKQSPKHGKTQESKTEYKEI